MFIYKSHHFILWHKPCVTLFQAAEKLNFVNDYCVLVCLFSREIQSSNRERLKGDIIREEFSCFAASVLCRSFFFFISNIPAGVAEPIYRRDSPTALNTDYGRDSVNAVKLAVEEDQCQRGC